MLLRVDPDDRLTLLRERARRVPTGPGVYRWLDGQGRILYVGKAANLRPRVRSYLSKRGDGRPLVHLLMRRAADVDVISTNTPEEALLLENTLIKQAKPPYNLRLKDDKSYLLVRVDRTHAFPRCRHCLLSNSDRFVGEFRPGLLRQACEKESCGFGGFFQPL